MGALKSGDWGNEMKLFLTLVLIGVFIFPSDGYSKNQITMSSSVNPAFIDGKLQGCSLVFRVAKEKNKHSADDFLLAAGSLNYYAFEEQHPVFALKLIVIDWKSKDEISVDNAYLISGYNTNYSDFMKKIDDASSGQIFLYNAGDSSFEVVASSAISGKLSVGFTMSGRSLADTFDVDLNMKELNIDRPENSLFDETASRRWMECIKKATEGTLENMKGK